jgi:uncharacterized protein with PIN domain
MLGGLARWLRAAGYSAWFDVHIRDGRLVRLALEKDRWLLTSDSGLMERYAVSEGLVPCIFVPRELSPVGQLGYVLGELDLPLREPRCMDCDGELKDVPPQEVATDVPPRVLQAYRRFFRCTGCQKVYWRGTHWESIRARLAEALEMAGRGG